MHFFHTKGSQSALPNRIPTLQDVCLGQVMLLWYGDKLGYPSSLSFPQAVPRQDAGDGFAAFLG